MADHTRSSITIAATSAEVMAAIADFGSYPKWVGEVTATAVVELGDDGRARQVRLHIDGGVLRDEQVLAYRWDGERSVSWSLVSSRLLRGLDGSYVLAPSTGGGTDVTYQLAVNLKLPVLGLLKRQAERVIVDRALAGLKRHVESTRVAG